MTTVQHALDILSALAPVSLAMEGDNVGLLVGEPETPINKILVALDVTLGVLAEAKEKGAQLVVAHHPMPRKPLSKITPDTPDGQKVLFAIQNRMAILAMHTNLDAAEGGVNDVLAKTLGLSAIVPLPNPNLGIGRVGILPAPMPLEDFVALAASTLQTDNLRFSSGGKMAEKVAVGSGNCSDLWQDALACGADTFISADFKYSQMTAAAEQGLNLVDGGHFPTENIICPLLADVLAKALPETTVFLSETHQDVIQFFRDVT